MNFTDMTIPIAEKPRKKKKKYERFEDHTQMIPDTLNSVQNVETFKNFLLQNDSQFSEYLNSDIIKATFDTHMMKEGMITFMAQMMGNGSTKDNFFLKTRSAL